MSNGIVAESAVERPGSRVRTAAESRAAAQLLKRLDAFIKDEVKKSFGFYFAPSQKALRELRKTKVGSVALTEQPEGGGFLLHLSGGDPAAKSDGRTEGFCIRLPEEFEREASGRKVQIKVLVRSAGLEPTRIAIAYSTNEVGNSGWQWKDVAPSWGICKMAWKVPPMKAGGGDFVGLMPDKSGAGGVEVHSVLATVIE